MIEVDNFWHLKTFGVVLTNFQRRWDEEIHEQKDMSMHCTENSKTNGELDGKEVIDLCSENQTATSELKKGQTRKSGHNGTKQSQGWRANIGLKKIIKWLKQRKSK